MPLPEAMRSREPVAVVTGANCGVGFETARQLSASGYGVVMGCRSKTRCLEALTKIMEEREAQEHPERWGGVTMLELDLADPHSVEYFARQLKEAHPSGIDALVNNGGIGGFRRTPEPTVDGHRHDLVFRTNFLGHFQLTLLLLPMLSSAPDGRIVNVGSVAHRQIAPRAAELNWEDCLLFESGVSKYACSKLALHVFSVELGRRLAKEGTTSVTAITVNPGAVNSKLWYRSQLGSGRERMLRTLFGLVLLSPKQGAAPLVSAVTDPRWKGATNLYLTPYRTPASKPMPFEIHGPFAGTRECVADAATLDPRLGGSLYETATGALLEINSERYAPLESRFSEGGVLYDKPGQASPRVGIEEQAVKQAIDSISRPTPDGELLTEEEVRGGRAQQLFQEEHGPFDEDDIKAEQEYMEKYRPERHRPQAGAGVSDGGVDGGDRRRTRALSPLGAGRSLSEDFTHKSDEFLDAEAAAEAELCEAFGEELFGDGPPKERELPTGHVVDISIVSSGSSAMDNATFFGMVDESANIAGHVAAVDDALAGLPLSMPNGPPPDATPGSQGYSYDPLTDLVSQASKRNFTAAQMDALRKKAQAITDQLSPEMLEQASLTQVSLSHTQVSLSHTDARAGKSHTSQTHTHTSLSHTHKSHAHKSHAHTSHTHTQVTRTHKSHAHTSHTHTQVTRTHKSHAHRGLTSRSHKSVSQVGLTKWTLPDMFPHVCHTAPSLSPCTLITGRLAPCVCVCSSSSRRGPWSP